MFLKKCIPLLLITYIISNTALAQVTNGTTFYYQQQLHILEWTKDSDTGSGDPEEPAWRLIYGANSAVCDDEDTWGPDFYDDCFHFSSGGPHTVSNGSILFNPGSPVPFNSEIKVDIRGHENDDISGSVEAACEADGNDDDEECGERTFTVADGLRGDWRFFTNTESNFKWTWKALWRYANGDNQITPLDFGTLSSETVSHDNTTDGPIGAVVGTTTYNNNNNVSQSGRDVFYKFNIQKPMKVTISTLNGTNFDTYLYLYRSIRYPTTVFLENDNAEGSTRSKIEAVICPGTYLIVVDGKNGASGDFKLSLTVSDDISEALSTGSIDTYTTAVIDGAPIPIIKSNAPSTNSVLNTNGISYQWEKSENLGVSWQDIVNSHFESLPVGSVTMGSNDVYLRRKATSLCIDVFNPFIDTTNTVIVPSATSLNCNTPAIASTSASSTLQDAPSCNNRGAASNPNGSQGKWFYGFASNDGIETIRVKSITAGKHPNVFVYERFFDPEIFDDGSEFPGYFCNSSNSGKLTDNTELLNEVTVTIDSEIDINGDLFIFVSAVEGGPFDFEITRDCNPNCENQVRYQNDHFLPSLTQGQEIELNGGNKIRENQNVSLEHSTSTSIFPEFEVVAGSDFMIGLTGCN